MLVIMCGRYSRRWDKQRIAEAFQTGNVDGLVYEEERKDEWARRTELQRGSADDAAGGAQFS
jgi:hypothetical protein